MSRKCLLWIFFLLGALCQNTQANPKNEITMLVVPRDAKTIQIAQDISRRYPVLIVSYQQTPEQVKLYAWNGDGWVDIPVEDYTNGVFFANRPHHTIIVEAENTPAEDLLVPDGTWCDSGNRLLSTEPHVLIHLLGRYFDFPFRIWRQFSMRHNEPFEKINPAFINTYWWHHYGEDIFAKRSLRDPEADMDKWLYLDITPPPPIEPVVVEEEPEPVPPAEIPAVKPVDLSANSPTKALAEAESSAKKDAAPETPDGVEDAEPAAEEVPTIEETAKEIIKEPIPEIAVDPFSATEIPAAEIVLPPAK